MSKTLYLDSRDLINVIRFGDPVTADELRRTLQDRDTTLVYSFSNVLEVVNFGDDAEQQRRLGILGSFPKTFIAALPRLLESEFMQALLAFYSGMSRVPQVKPFRSQLHQTFAHHVRPLPGESFQNIVMTMLKKDPNLGKNTEQDLRYYMAEVALDRAWPANERQTWDWFRGGIGHMLIKCGIGQFPQNDLEPFCRWLVKHGEALPAWRVFHGAQAAFTDNIGDPGEPGDPPDYSHITAVCYVDSATLDNRMRGYYSSAIRRLKKAYPHIKYFEHRVLRNLAAWL